MRAALSLLVLLTAGCASASDPYTGMEREALLRATLAAAERGDRAAAEAAGTIYLRRFPKGPDAGELRTTILPWALCGMHRTPQESLRDLEALAADALPPVASCVLIVRSDLRAALGDLEGARADLQRADDLVPPPAEVT